jgi:DNA-binding NarL/FixJ family response regulator
MLTREGIVRLLGDVGIEVVGQVDEGARLLRMVAGTSPDVAIVDIRMPPTHTDEGLVAAQRIPAEHPATGSRPARSRLENRTSGAPSGRS